MSREANILLGTLGLIVSVALIGWVAWRLLRRSESPGLMTVKAVFTLALVIGSFVLAARLGPYGVFVIVLMGLVLSIMWTPHISDWVTRPLTGLFTGDNESQEARPLYSMAYAKRKRGMPVEAVAEVRGQLAKFPNDFEGVTLLAEIQAHDLQDLPGAEITLKNFCAAKGTPPRQVFAALNMVADFHLKLTLDEEAARTALEEIVTRFPDSELATQARQRLAHLHGAVARQLAHHDQQPVEVPEGVHNLGLRGAEALVQPKETEPGQLAAEYVRHLEQHPQDVEAREKLALLYARHFQRLDLATAELEQLVAQPHQPAKRVIEWLNLLATLQVELGAEQETVRATLQRIGERFPGSPGAAVADRRLARLNLEFKGRQETSGVKLGEYEQRLGLKYGRPGEGGKTPV